METLDPITGPASVVMDKVKQLAAAIIEHPGIDTFRIGRTNHPMGHRVAYKCVELFTIYKSFDPFNAKRVEAELLEIYQDHAKWSRVPDPELAVSADMAQFVYIAAW